MKGRITMKTERKGRVWLKWISGATLAAWVGAPGCFAQDESFVEVAEIEEAEIVSGENVGWGGIDFAKAENILSGMDYSASFGWYSRYVCEGIDCWDTGYFVGTLGASYDDRWFFRFWYGLADGHNNAGERCGETKLRVDYKLSLGALDIIPWFEQSFIRQDNDRGVPRPGVKTVYRINDIFSAGTDFYWQDYDLATGDRGKFRGYYAAYVAAHYAMNDQLAFDASIRYGYNGGYVQQAPHGSNSLDYTLGATYALSDYCALEATLAYSQALTALRHEDLGDELYGGLGIRFAY